MTTETISVDNVLTATTTDRKAVDTLIAKTLLTKAYAAAQGFAKKSPVATVLAKHVSSVKGLAAQARRIEYISHLGFNLIEK